MRGDVKSLKMIIINNGCSGLKSGKPTEESIKQERRERSDGKVDS